MTRQTNLRDDTNNSGLPEADDYDPNALGTIEFRAGEPEQQWAQFGLEMVPIEYRAYNDDEWTDTGRRQIVRNGDFIADVSEDYQLLPNERLVDVANGVARDLGAEPFHEFDGDWYVELDDHVFQDKDRRRVHANYAWQTGEVGDDSMEYGFAVHNSIDGSLGFSVALFSFRYACANMVYLGTGSYREQMALAVEEEREVLSRHSQQHTKGLSVDREGLRATIKGTLTLIDDVDDTYERWVSQEVTPSEVRDLLKRPQLASRDLPEWVAEIPDVLADHHEDDDSVDEDEQMPWEEQAEIIEAEIPSGTTVWGTYNDITEAIWKSGDAADQTRRSKMKDLHRVFQPAEHGESDMSLR